ncbi:MAG: hypothetical protein ACREGH_03380 [Minisyncoccia bacterium]
MAELPLPLSIILALVLLAIFLVFTVVIKYAMDDEFGRTRALMTAFFFFIIATLTVSFYDYASATLPYTAPAAVIGILLGYFVGVRAAHMKLSAQGIQRYMEDFAHIHRRDVVAFNWWSIINFYSIMGGLVLVNFVGLSTVLMHDAKNWAIATSSVGAFLIGTIVPYLLHLWMIRARPAVNSK